MPQSPLSTSDSSIKVANAALNEIGHRPITSFVQGGLAARTLNTVFADALEAALSLYPWTFAKRHIAVQRLSADPPAGWDALYQIPGEALVVRTLYLGRRTIPFDIFEDRVAADIGLNTNEDIRIEATVYKEPSAWPGYFRRAFVFDLASQICVPITQDQKMALELQKWATILYSKAKSRDAQGRTSQRLDTQTFIRARRNHRRTR